MLLKISAPRRVSTVRDPVSLDPAQAIARGTDGLHSVVTEPDPDTMKRLMQALCSCEKDRRQSSLQVLRKAIAAAVADHPNILQYREPSSGRPIVYSALYDRNVGLDLLRMLLAAQQDWRGTDPQGDTVLHQLAACWKRDPGAVLAGFPLEEANFSVRNHAGWTPLHQAAARGHVAFLRFACRAVGDLRAVSGCADLTDLLELGDAAGNTCLHHAVMGCVEQYAVDATPYNQERRKKTLQFLLDQQRDLLAQNTDGKTAYDLALELRDPAIARMVLEAGSATQRETLQERAVRRTQPGGSARVRTWIQRWYSRRPIEIAPEPNPVSVPAVESPRHGARIGGVVWRGCVSDPVDPIPLLSSAGQGSAENTPHRPFVERAVLVADPAPGMTEGGGKDTGMFWGVGGIAVVAIALLGCGGWWLACGFLGVVVCVVAGCVVQTYGRTDTRGAVGMSQAPVLPQVDVEHVPLVGYSRVPQRTVPEDKHHVAGVAPLSQLVGVEARALPPLVVKPPATEF